MLIKFEINNRIYSSDTSKPIEISIPLNFHGDQPNTYNVDRASAKAYEMGNFIGDTRRGGGCNFEEYKLIPHCNGTHTEGVGHISFERISINKILRDTLIPVSLITVKPEPATETNETYIPKKNEDDMLITKKVLREKLIESDKSFLDGLIIRTLPNDDSKGSRKYMEKFPSFFSIDAMRFIDSLKIKHLLMDIPSVDRTFDEGKLTAHHIFWNVPEGSHEVDIEDHSLRTITEMIYAPDRISDGKYLMNIQIPDFIADAAPSRIFLFKIN